MVNPNLFSDNSTVKIDNVKPTFGEQFPADSIFVNTDSISYQLSETVDSTYYLWTWVGGNEDINSPHLINLDSLQLEGDQVHSIIDSINLVDGGIYDVLWKA